MGVQNVGGISVATYIYIYIYIYGATEIDR